MATSAAPSPLKRVSKAERHGKPRRVPSDSLRSFMDCSVDRSTDHPLLRQTILSETYQKRISFDLTARGSSQLELEGQKCRGTEPLDPTAQCKAVARKPEKKEKKEQSDYCALLLQQRSDKRDWTTFSSAQFLSPLHRNLRSYKASCLGAAFYVYAISPSWFDFFHFWAKFWNS